MKSGRQRRNTPQRRVILEELKKLHIHPTAAELYEIARLRLPKLSIGTVYRNLEILHSDGLIRKLDGNGAEARFDGNLDPHYHVRCVRCGRVDDIYGLSELPSLSGAGELTEYRLLGRRLEFFGICPGCEEEEQRESDEILSS